MRNRVLMLAILSIATTRVYGWTSVVCSTNALQLFPLIVPNQKSDGGVWVEAISKTLLARRYKSITILGEI